MDSGPIVLKQKRRKAALVTERQAISAATACGYSVLKVECLKDKARLGRYIEELGAAQIGRTTLLVIAEEAYQDAKKIQNFIERNDGGEICMIMDLYKLKAAYLDLGMRASASQMKGSKSETPIEINTPTVMAFPPGTILSSASQVKIPDQPAQLNEVNDATKGE